MATATLVEFARDAGRNLLQKLDAMNVPITAAFWEFREDDEAWRLVLASPDTATKGPLYVVQQVHKALDALTDAQRDGLSIIQTAVVGPQRIKLRDMRTRYGIVETEREPLDRWTIYSRSEPYIYRLLPA